VVVEAARDLERAATAGNPPQVLRGRNIALLDDGQDPKGREAFISAASDLGARVACVGFPDLRTSQGDDIQETARLLGLLYDAIVCSRCDPAHMTWLERHAGIPVCGRPDAVELSIAIASGEAADSRYLLLAQLRNKLARPQG
jgi:ornithine carbamoyltransferase